MEDKLSFLEDEQEITENAQEPEKNKLDTSVVIINSLDLTVESTTQVVSEILSSSSYKKQSECQVCQKKFGIFLKKRHCKFCGNCVCDNHAKRRRANPQKLQKFVRCCDTCHYNYLKKIVEDDFQIERKEKEQKVREIQSQLKEKQKYRRIKEKEFKDIEEQFKNDLKDFNESRNIFDDEILKYNEQIKDIEEQIAQLGSQNEQLEQEISEIIEKISAGTQEIGKNMQEIDEEKEKLINLQNEIQSKKQSLQIKEKFLNEVQEKEEKKGGSSKKENDQNPKSKVIIQQEEKKPEKKITQQIASPQIIQNEEPKIQEEQKLKTSIKDEQFIKAAKKQKKIEPQDSQVNDVNSCKICAIY